MDRKALRNGTIDLHSRCGATPLLSRLAIGGLLTISAVAYGGINDQPNLTNSHQVSLTALTATAGSFAIDGSGSPADDGGVLAIDGSGSPEDDAGLFAIDGSGSPTDETDLFAIDGSGVPEGDAESFAIDGSGAPEGDGGALAIDGSGLPGGEGSRLAIDGSGATDGGGHLAIDGSGGPGGSDDRLAIDGSGNPEGTDGRFAIDGSGAPGESGGRLAIDGSGSDGESGGVLAIDGSGLTDDSDGRFAIDGSGQPGESGDMLAIDGSGLWDEDAQVDHFAIDGSGVQGDSEGLLAIDGSGVEGIDGNAGDLLAIDGSGFEDDGIDGRFAIDGSGAENGGGSDGPLAIDGSGANEDDIGNLAGTYRPEPCEHQASQASLDSTLDFGLLILPEDVEYGLEPIENVDLKCSTVLVRAPAYADVDTADYWRVASYLIPRFALPSELIEGMTVELLGRVREDGRLVIFETRSSGEMFVPGVTGAVLSGAFEPTGSSYSALGGLSVTGRTQGTRVVGHYYPGSGEFVVSN